MPKLAERDRAVLTAPLPADGLEVGDVGTVVHVYPDGCAFEVEFTTLDGRTVAVVTADSLELSDSRSRRAYVAIPSSLSAS